MIKNSTTYLKSAGLLMTIAMFYSCAPKYTADFGQSSRFYTAKNEVKEVKEESIQSFSEPQGVVDKQEVIEANVVTQPIVMTPKMEDITKRIESYASKSNMSKAEVKKAVKSDLKELRAEVKKEMKEGRAEFKANKKKAKKNAVYFNKKMTIGTIIAAAGIVVALLASSTIGGLGIIVGVVLIAWGLIEQV